MPTGPLQLPSSTVFCLRKAGELLRHETVICKIDLTWGEVFPAEDWCIAAASSNLCALLAGRPALF
jgi:hypothetical protein